jgi:hypothetical protein
VYGQDAPVVAAERQALARKGTFESLEPEFIATGAEATSMLKALNETDTIHPSIYHKHSDVLLTWLFRAMP